MAQELFVPVHLLVMRYSEDNAILFFLLLFLYESSTCHCHGNVKLFQLYNWSPAPHLPEVCGVSSSGTKSSLSCLDRGLGKVNEHMAIIRQPRTRETF